MKKNYWLLLTFFLYVGKLSALSLYITNDHADMMNAKKICVRLSLDSNEAAIYKDTLCISVDTPDIELKGWRTVAQAPATYVASFKKNKRLFTESFNLEIFIDFERKDKQQQAQVLDNAYISVSSLVLTKTGKNKAENVVVPLKVSDIAEDLVSTATTQPLGLIAEYTSTLLPYQRSFDFFNRTKRVFGKQDINEVLIIDRMKDLWGGVRWQIAALITPIAFYKWYFALWLILLLLLLRLFHPAFRFVIPLSLCSYREILLLVSILMVILTWWLLRWYVAPQWWYGVLGIGCIPGACYYLWGGTETFLDRLKVLVGIIFAVALLPLLALACMHGNFDAVMRCFK